MYRIMISTTLVVFLVIYFQLSTVELKVDKTSTSVAILKESCNDINIKLDGLSDAILPIIADRQALSEPSICLMETDMSGTITACSDGVVDVLGYAPEDIIHKNVDIFMNHSQKILHDRVLDNTAYRKIDGPMCDRVVQIRDHTNSVKLVRLQVSKYTSKSGPRYIMTIKENVNDDLDS